MRLGPPAHVTINNRPMSDQNYDFKTEERILFKHTLPYAVKQLKNGKVVMTFENTGVDVINDYGHRHFADLLAKVVAGQLFGKAQELEVMYEAAGDSHNNDNLTD